MNTIVFFLFILIFSVLFGELLNEWKSFVKIVKGWFSGNKDSKDYVYIVLASIIIGTAIQIMAKIFIAIGD